MQMSMRPRNAEGKICERSNSAVKHDMPFQIFNDARGIVVLYLPSSHLTEIVNFFLGRRADEARVIDSKISLQLHSFDQASLPRRNRDLRFEVHRSGQRRAIGMGEEFQPVLYPALRF